jgi:hypothetical protein
MTEEKVKQSNGTLSVDRAVKEPQPSKGSHKPWRFLLIGGLFLLIVLALALGLGLGLGLKQHNNSDLAVATPSTTIVASPTPTPSPSGAPTPLEPWRLDTSEYNLDLSWNISAPPTTRIFNLTVSEIEAAPDGKFLHMMLVR